jgi:hypothetical protein
MDEQEPDLKNPLVLHAARQCGWLLGGKHVIRNTDRFGEGKKRRER